LVRRGTGVGKKLLVVGASCPVNPITPIQRNDKTSAQIPKVVLFITETSRKYCTATGVPF